ncbi:MULTISPECIES: hypothetical protein [Enterobacteriaceae]|uniref:hypothetical protein n=1 Tax=Enterobacteriaceae TaxID=543 RepID=UPI00066A2FF2|nr:hypothetical protein [Escherichia coli]EDL6560248.1 hypothetical protein [Salmonella enterica subsp. enterica serovar Java]EFP7547078.1 hypothetical protein [Shigella sonnei]EGD7783122.1 hypothetical protein [Shigella flexneri]EGY2021188.1 hypothetical protein [Salmonella enterica]MCY5677678.1 hypothetical protein [Salmonella enterica subsp. enterica serovar 1,4,[5],12:i:-]
MAMGSVVHLLFFLSEQCYLMPFSTYRIGTEASANPVCGERLVHLTEVTAIWVLTGEHLTGEITAEELCLCTLPVEMVPVAVIAPTHQIFRAM